MAVIAVLTNLPDSDSAFNLAREVVRLRLAACANVLSPATSFSKSSMLPTSVTGKPASPTAAETAAGTEAL